MGAELQTLNNKSITIDSREVAEMLGKTHGDLLKDIKGSGKNLGIIPILEKGNFPISEYFIESSYKVEGNNKTYKCFLCTKMGCEMLGNKLQGEKGILFTAKYVKRFNEMEKKLKEVSEQQFKLPQTYKEALLQLVEQVEANEKLQLENENLSLENRLLQGEKFEWAGRSLINALVRKYSTSVYNDFSKGWVEFKKSLLYTYSININSRITNYLNETGKKTKPKTLDMLKTDEEVSQGIITILTMCKDSKINIEDIIKHFKDTKNN